MTGRISTLLGVLVLMLFSLPVFGQTFSTPLQLNGFGTFSGPRVDVGQGNGVAVLFHDAQDIYHSSSQGGFGQPTQATMTGGISAHARLEVGALFVSQVVFDEDTSLPGQTGKDIFVISSQGSGFSLPVNLTETNGVDETFPTLALLGSGSRDITYQSQAGAAAPEIYVVRDSGSPVFVAAGSTPVIAAIGNTETFIAYERAGSLYGRTFDGTVVGAEEVIANDTSTHSSLEIAVDGSNNVHCGYLDGGALTYRRRNAGGGYTSEETLDLGPVQQPSIAANISGNVGIAVARTGQIHYHVLNMATWTSSNVAPMAFGASEPSLGIDDFGFSHLAFTSGSNVSYVSDVPAPSASFEATSNNGVLPHVVAFNNTSSGIINSVLWDFGDGNTSTALNPTHTYVTAGLWTVTLTTTGPGGSSVDTKPNFISSTLPANVIQLPTLPVEPGQSVLHPILGTHPELIQGFQVTVVYDDGFIPITGLSLNGSLTAGFGPDFEFQQVTPNGPNSKLEAAVLLETQPPFSGQLIPPGAGQFLAALEYTVPALAQPGINSSIMFEDGLGTNNVFAPAQGPSITPWFLHGGIEIVAAGSDGDLFVRGNANALGNIDIADAVFVLTFLFAGGAAPPCPDAADSNDNGAVEIADAVNILTFLFAGNVTTPKYPFPLPGLDPTADNLGPCVILSP